MARVFLSYDRDDAAHAAPVAAALERAGHSVWWDQHLRGGSQFSKEIERALNASDAVVVLWSERSVESAWVRDEAASGRDRNILVPISLNSTLPPLGFRQFHSIALPKCRLDRASRNAVLSAIEAVASGASTQPKAPIARVAQALNPAPWIIAVALALAAIAALVWWQPWKPDRKTPKVAIEAADAREQSRAFANDLLVQLGSLQAADAGSIQLVEASGSERADLLFKVRQSGGTRAGVVLLSGSPGEVLWSREFEQADANQADLRQQVAYTAATILRCATEALAPGHPELGQDTFRLYLNGCADLSTEDPRTATTIFRRVTQKAPRFAAGWGKLLVAELEAFKGTAARDEQLQNDLRRHVAEARRVNGELAEIDLVQSWLQPPRPIHGWMRFADDALEKNPDNAAILENYATGMTHFGRMRDAVQSARRATEVEPLSPSARQHLIVFLMDSGEFKAARRELSEAERLWPGASSLLQVRFLFESRYGDPNIALELLESGRLDFVPTKSQKSFLQARIDRTPANIERAIDDAYAAYREAGSLQSLVAILGEFGRTDEIIDLLLKTDPRQTPGLIVVFFRPPLNGLRRDRRFMAVAHRYGLVEYWRVSGRWPDFCFEADLPYDCKAEAAKLS